jgi:glycosyltransferase involved in cell wall biosynthesis
MNAMKLAIFVDQIYWDDGGVYSSDEAYVLFPLHFRSAFAELLFLGRVSPERARKPYVITQPGVTFCALPWYGSVYDLWKAGPRLYQQIRRIIRAQAGGWDAVWVAGPNPVAQVIGEESVSLGRPLFQVVRQNLVRQMRVVNRGGKGVLAVVGARWLEWRFQRLARGRTVFCVGEEMTNSYRAVTDKAHVHFSSRITRQQLAMFQATAAPPVPGRFLCVGRLAPEKGHRHLIEAVAVLNRAGDACTLDIVGDGPLAGALRAQVARLGLQHQVNFHGYVPFGPDLFAHYQRAFALAVPSLSEGLPQVIVEALAVGIPVVASAVGGIPSFLTEGRTGLLVPPADVPALSAALKQLLTQPELCQTLRCHGWAWMKQNTLEAQRDRMVEIIQREVIRK